MKYIPQRDLLINAYTTLPEGKTTNTRRGFTIGEFLRKNPLCLFLGCWDFLRNMLIVNLKIMSSFLIKKRTVRASKYYLVRSVPCVPVGYSFTNNGY